MGNKSIKLSAALSEHLTAIERIKIDLLRNKLTPEQAGEILRSYSIRLGEIACMPFREE